MAKKPGGGLAIINFSNVLYYLGYVHRLLKVNDTALSLAAESLAVSGTLTLIFVEFRLLYVKERLVLLLILRILIGMFEYTSIYPCLCLTLSFDAAINMIKTLKAAFKKRNGISVYLCSLYTARYLRKKSSDANLPNNNSYFD